MDIPPLLPDELLQAIFQRVVLTHTLTPDHFSEDFSFARPWDKPPPAISRPLSPIALVCRRWRNVSTPLLYETVVLHKWNQVKALRESLERNRNLQLMVRHFHLLFNLAIPENAYHLSPIWRRYADPNNRLIVRQQVDDLVHLLRSLKRLKKIETFALSPYFWDAITSHIGGPGLGSRRAIRRSLRVLKIFTGSSGLGFGVDGVKRLLVIFPCLDVIHISKIAWQDRPRKTYPELQARSIVSSLKILSIGQYVCGSKEVGRLLSCCPNLLSLRISLGVTKNFPEEPTPDNEEEGEDYLASSTNPGLCKLMAIPSVFTSLQRLVDLELGTGSGVSTAWGDHTWDGLSGSGRLGRLNDRQRQRMVELFEKEAYKGIKYLALGGGISPPPSTLPPSLEHLHLRLPVMFYSRNPDNQIPYSYPIDILQAKVASQGSILPKLKSVELEDAFYEKSYPSFVIFGDQATRVQETYPFELIKEAYAIADCPILLEGFLAWEPSERRDHLASIASRTFRDDREYWNRFHKAVVRVAEELRRVGSSSYVG